MKGSQAFSDQKIWGQLHVDDQSSESSGNSSESSSISSDDEEEVSSEDNEGSIAEDDVQVITPPPTQANRPIRGEKRPPGQHVAGVEPSSKRQKGNIF